MAQKGLQVTQMGLEVTRGTPVTTTLALAMEEGQFMATPVNGLGERMPNVTFPYMLQQVPVGTTWKLALAVEFNRDNCRDLLLLATKRTSGVLPSVTIIDNQYGIGVARYSGCVCSSFTLSAARGGSPARESIWIARMEFDCMFGEAAGTIQSLTAATAPFFQLRHSTALVNNVAQATGLLGINIALANALALGPVNATNTRLWIEDGMESNELQYTGRFTTTAKQLLVEAGTEAATNTLVIATGTANETLTATIGKGQLATRSLGDDNGTMTEQLTFLPYHTGSAAPIVWTYGSSIGASVLGL